MGVLRTTLTSEQSTSLCGRSTPPGYARRAATKYDVIIDKNIVYSVVCCAGLYTPNLQQGFQSTGSRLGRSLIYQVFRSSHREESSRRKGSPGDRSDFVLYRRLPENRICTYLTRDPELDSRRSASILTVYLYPQQNHANVPPPIKIRFSTRTTLSMRKASTPASTTTTRTLTGATWRASRACR